jgi:hypothetical protein
MAIGTVITADIVNSTSLPKAVHQKLIGTIKSLIEPNKFEFYQGDSFQVYMKENAKALRLILQIRLAAKRIDISDTDVRAGIGIGQINTQVKKLNINREEPFILSGRSLNQLSGLTGRIAISTFDDNANFAMGIISRFADYILRDITSKQAAVIFELLMGHNQTKTAQKLKKSQTTINKQVHAAGWTDLETLLMDYEYAIHQFIMT